MGGNDGMKSWWKRIVGSYFFQWGYAGIDVLVNDMVPIKKGQIVFSDQ